MACAPVAISGHHTRHKFLALRINPYDEHGRASTKSLKLDPGWKIGRVRMARHIGRACPIDGDTRSSLPSNSSRLSFAPHCAAEAHGIFEMSATRIELCNEHIPIFIRTNGAIDLGTNEVFGVR